MTGAALSVTKEHNKKIQETRMKKLAVIAALAGANCFALPVNHVDAVFSQSNWYFYLTFDIQFDEPVDFITAKIDGHNGWYSNIVPTSSLGGGISGYMAPDFSPSWIYGPDQDHTISYTYELDGITYPGDETYTYHITMPTGESPAQLPVESPLPDGGGTLALLGLALGSLAFKR